MSLSISISGGVSLSQSEVRDGEKVHLAHRALRVGALSRQLPRELAVRAVVHGDDLGLLALHGRAHARLRLQRAQPPRRQHQRRSAQLAVRLAHAPWHATSSCVFPPGWLIRLLPAVIRLTNHTYMTLASSMVR